MSNNDFDFDDIDLDGCEDGTNTTTVEKSNVIPLVIKETVEGSLVIADQEKELTEEETKAIEKDAKDNTADVNNIDSFMDQYKQPTKAELEKTKKVEENKVKLEAAAKAPKVTPKTPVVEEKYEGPRTIRVYGSELFIESDLNVTLEEIRQRLVDEFKFVEFSKERTTMFLDKASGIVVPQPHFEKKG